MVHGHTTTVMHDTSTPLPPRLARSTRPPFSRRYRLCPLAIPPPPPVTWRRSIFDVGQHEEVTATVSEWTPAAEPRYLDSRYVAPHAPSLSTVARGDEQQQQQQEATRVSDYSSLYSPPTNLAVSHVRRLRL